MKNSNNFLKSMYSLKNINHELWNTAPFPFFQVRTLLYKNFNVHLGISVYSISLLSAGQIDRGTSAN